MLTIIADYSSTGLGCINFTTNHLNFNIWVNNGAVGTILWLWQLLSGNYLKNDIKLRYCT